MSDQAIRQLSLLLRLRRQDEQEAELAFQDARRELDELSRHVAAARTARDANNRLARRTLLSTEDATRNPEPGTGNTEPKTRNSEPGTRKTEYGNAHTESGGMVASASHASSASGASNPALTDYLMFEYRRQLGRIEWALADSLARCKEAQDRLEARRLELAAAQGRRQAVQRLVDRLSAGEARKVHRLAAHEQDDLFAAHRASMEAP